MKIVRNLFILFVLFFAYSCKTNQVFINVTNPAPVTLSNFIKKVGIVNRSIPSDDNKALINIHQARSGETLQLIKDGGTECMKGLKESLIEAKRFESVNILSQTNLKTPVMGAFPTQLTWEEVEAICKNYDVEVLFVFEVFDTDLKIVPIITQPRLDKPIDVINTVTQQQANITTTVKTGWRIYDPRQKLLLDEFPMTDRMTVTASVLNLTNTVEALLGRKDAIKQSANRMGVDYAQRLLPVYTSVTRDYYVKGSNQFKIATRRARAGNWNGAAELWQKETKNPKRKIAGRAHYNMAIINEINGDLDAAIDWAQKAYEDYNNKLALRYINMLKYRKQSNNKLQFQQNN